MGRLRMLAPRIATLAPRLARVEAVVDRSAQRDRDVAWRKWYKTARWQRLRWAVLLRDLFTCQRCKRLEVDTSQLVGDHIAPHRGDEVLFWDADNVQCLCKTCHDSDKQREERAAWNR